MSLYNTHTLSWDWTYLTNFYIIEHHRNDGLTFLKSGKKKKDQLSSWEPSHLHEKTEQRMGKRDYSKTEMLDNFPDFNTEMNLR